MHIVPACFFEKKAPPPVPPPITFFRRREHNYRLLRLKMFIYFHMGFGAAGG